MKAKALLVVLLLISIVPAMADVKVEVQRDGYLYVQHKFEVTAGLPVALGLLGDPEELIVLEGGRPAYYTIEGDELLVYPTMNTTLSVTYYTSSSTYKAGPFWFLKLNLSEPAEIRLPEGAGLVGINEIPSQIISEDDRLLIYVGPGEWNITYILQRNGQQGAEFWPMWLLILPLLLLLLFFVLKKRPRIETVREDDHRILEFLKSRGGVAYSSEVQKALALPKTTAWRAMRRLERAGLVTIEKDEYGRNIVKLKR